MKKLAIVGTASSWKDAPYDDDEFEIWAMNDMYDLVPRFDVLFDIHDIDFIKSYVSRISKTFHYDNLKRIGENQQIWMQNQDKDIKLSSTYPLEDMIKKYGRYFTNSVSYMLALAMDSGFEVINIYGVNMTGGGEYQDQKPSCEYFIGLARGQGIEVYLPEQSDLLKANFMYGYEQNKADPFIEKCKNRMKFLDKQKQQTEKQIQGLTTLLNRTEGSIEDLKYIMNTY